MWMINKLKNIKFALFLAFSVFLGFSSQAQAALPLEGVSLNVSVPVSPPFIYITDAVSNPQGIEIDLIKEIQRRTGFTLQNNRINLMNISDVLDLAAKGKVDIAGGCLTLTDARSEIFDFTPSYIKVSNAIVVNKNSNINSLDDITNHRLAAVRGSNSTKTALRLFGDKVQVDQVSTAFMGFYRLSKGLSDVMIADDMLALDYINTWANSNLKVIYAFGKGKDNIGFLLKKGSKYNPIIQETVADIIADGTMEKIINKHTVERYTQKK